MSIDEKLDDIFVQPYIRGQEPFNITVAGKLPIKDGDYKIYNAPYPLIKHALKALITEARIDECEQLMALKWSVDERIAELKAGKE